MLGIMQEFRYYEKLKKLEAKFGSAQKLSKTECTQCSLCC